MAIQPKEHYITTVYNCLFRENLLYMSVHKGSASCPFSHRTFTFYLLHFTLPFDTLYLHVFFYIWVLLHQRTKALQFTPQVYYFRLHSMLNVTLPVLSLSCGTRKWLTCLCMFVSFVQKDLMNISQNIDECLHKRCPNRTDLIRDAN